MTRPLPFVLAATDHGPMIVSRLDRHQMSNGGIYGVGQQLLDFGSYEAGEIDSIREEIKSLKELRGPGLVVVDCGANIGVITIEIAKMLGGLGRVVGIEAQERLYYALCGNIALANVFNASAVFAAVSSEVGIIKIPSPNYNKPASLGSLELRKRENTEFIGQSISYAQKDLISVRTVTIDSLELSRLDFLKIDIEGMELEALKGAEKSLASFAPTILIEILKTDPEEIKSFLSQFNYTFVSAGMNLLARAI